MRASTSSSGGLAPEPQGAFHRPSPRNPARAEFTGNPCTRTRARPLQAYVTSPAREEPHTDDLRSLIRDHQVAVWRYLRFLGCDTGQADDLTQETFLAVVRRPVHRFGRSGARAYLRTVARNFYLRLRERRRREPAMVDLDTAEAAFDWYSDADDGASALAALRSCLTTISSAGQDALALRYREGLDRKSIAARMAMSSHGVKSLLQRSYAKLRVCMERRLQDER